MIHLDRRSERNKRHCFQTDLGSLIMSRHLIVSGGIAPRVPTLWVGPPILTRRTPAVEAADPDTLQFSPNLRGGQLHRPRRPLPES
jgi:hypothetical protein